MTDHATRASSWVRFGPGNWNGGSPFIASRAARILSATAGRCRISCTGVSVATVLDPGPEQVGVGSHRHPQRPDPRRQGVGRRHRLAPFAQRFHVRESRPIVGDLCVIPRGNPGLGDLVEGLDERARIVAVRARSTSRNATACLKPTVRPRPADGFVHAQASATATNPVATGEPPTTKRR